MSKKDVFDIIMSVKENETIEEMNERKQRFLNYMKTRAYNARKPRINKEKIYQKQLDIISSCTKSIMYMLDWSPKFSLIYDNVQDIDKIDFKVITNFIYITYSWLNYESDKKLHNELGDNIIKAMLEINVITNKANRIKTLNNI